MQTSRLCFAKPNAGTAAGTIDFDGFITHEVTPTSDFFVSTYSDVPDIATPAFRLAIDGMAARPYTLGLQQLLSMQDKREYVTIECIRNSVGGSAVGNALWEGVSLRRLIEHAEPVAEAINVACHGADGYSDSIPRTLAESGDVFVALRMNGRALTPRHGYPLRLIVPGRYGVKHVKWLSRIELTNQKHAGYWQRQGWSESAEVPLKSQILMPMDGKRLPLMHYVMGGTAYGGTRGIGAVEVSTDGGDHWQNAQLKRPLSRWSWVLWRYDWTPPHARSYTLLCRAVDRAGNFQQEASFLERLLGGTYPNGARGLHSVVAVAQSDPIPMVPVRGRRPGTS